MVYLNQHDHGLTQQCSHEVIGAMTRVSCICEHDDMGMVVSGEVLGPRRFGLSAGIDPTYRGPASLEAVSESSVSAAQVALQGLTCD